MKEINGELIFASVAEDASGIHMRVATDNNGFEIAFLPVNERMGDISLVLREGMDAEKELQKVCDLLNEDLKILDEKTGQIIGLKKRNIKIIEEQEEK